MKPAERMDYSFAQSMPYVTRNRKTVLSAMPVIGIAVLLGGFVQGLPPAAAESPPLQTTPEDPYKTAAQEYRNRIRALAAQEVKSALAEEAETLKQTPHQTSEGHLELALELQKEGKLFEALTHVQYALVLEPSNAHAKDLDAELREAFDRSIERKAKAERYMEKARSAAKDGKTRRAKKYLKKAAKLVPEDPKVQQALSQLAESGSFYVDKGAQAVRPQQLSVVRRPVNEYRVSRGDVIEVFVWQHNDLSRNVIVRPDGRISIPLVGDVEAAGRSLTELDAIITDRLKTYVRLPDVSLAIKHFGGTKTIVLGEVSNPGVYVPTEDGRIMELIAMAGGFTTKAEQRDVILIRGGMDHPQVAKLNLFDVMTQGRLENNVSLQPNDIVYVPEEKVNSVIDFLEQFYPTLQNLLVGQNIAANFGVYETSGNAAERQ